MLLRFAATILCIACTGHAQITFRDVTDEVGLRVPLAGLMGHGGAWGDVDGDGQVDLFVGGFADRPDEEYTPAKEPLPSMLFLQREGGLFDEVRDSPVRHFARTSGAVFADLDNDGDLDLYVANNTKGKVSRETEPQRTAQMRGCSLFRNDPGPGAGSHSFVDISSRCGACPEGLLTARNIGVIDFDRDGLLDLFVVEDRFTQNPSSRLFRNLGGLKFADATVAAGLPEDIFGLGLATGDINGDGYTDIFVPHNNRLFLGAMGGKFREVEDEALAWDPLDNEDWPCGAHFADLNRDGRPDLVLSIHSVRARNKIFLNTGTGKDGVPVLRDVTDEAGLPAEIMTRCPHVEVQDFDNDGWPDIYLSAGWQDGEQGEITPCIFRNLGCKPGGVPKFELPGDFTKEMVYFPAGPSADFNNDGQRDLLLVNWFSGNHTRLLQNSSKDGGWLDVRVEGEGFNRMGIGSNVRVLAEGKLLGCGEVGTGYGYASGQSAWLHFGLGDAKSIDLELTFPNGKKLIRKDLKPNQQIVVRERE